MIFLIAPAGSQGLLGLLIEIGIGIGIEIGIGIGGGIGIRIGTGIGIGIGCRGGHPLQSHLHSQPLIKRRNI